ncbi:hypothetical protein K4F52_002447 [Lecanicillium sp. MT-2017a]|nr:hypothetical protein K4F52_002447 [Lecanicillium sp. MT-2017a]
MFGHYQFARGRMVNRAQNILLALQGLAGQGHYSCHYVVPNEKTATLLQLELQATEGANSSPERQPILDYCRLLALVRSQNWHQGDCVTFVIEVDYDFSAEFVLSLIELMFYAREPTGASIRVLTASKYNEVDRSLFQARYIICPMIPVWAVVNLPSNGNTNTEPLLLPRPAQCKDSVIDESQALIESCRAMKRSVLVMCHDAEVASLIPWAVERTLSYTHCTPDLIAATMRQAHEDDEDGGLVIFMSRACRLPIKVPKLKAIIVTGAHRTPRWRQGRIVHAIANMSQHEVDEAIDNAFETFNPEYQIDVLLPPAMSREQCPRRRIDNDQMWGLVMEVIARYTNVHAGILLSCFVTDSLVLDITLSQLCTLSCLRIKLDAEPGRSYEPGSQEGCGHLLQLLPIFKFNFFSAWLISVALLHPDFSLMAKRALIRIAAIDSMGTSILNAEKWRGRENVESLADRLTTIVFNHVRLPLEMFSQGHLWIALAAYEAAFRMPDGFGQNYRDVDVMENPLLSIRRSPAATVAKVVSCVEAALNIQPIGHEVLHLHNADCRLIQQAMTNAWMHRAVLIRSDTDAHGLQTTLHDLVKGDCMVNGSEKDMMPIDEALGPNSEELRGVVIAPELEEQFADEPSATRYYNSIVLPFECIAEWEDSNSSCKYHKAILCTVPEHNML